MSAPLTVKKIVISPAALLALSPEQRSTLLLLGPLLNEANWLRKILVQAVMGISDTPEGQAQFALVVTLATTLGSKLYEGWPRLNQQPIGPLMRTLPLPPELVALRKQLHPRFDGSGLVNKVRNQFGFHYPANLDFSRLPTPDEADTTLFVTDKGYRGDVFANISALAAIDALIVHCPHPDWHDSLREIWEEITDLAGGYCTYVSELIAFVLTQWLSGKCDVSDVVLPNVPSLDAFPAQLAFFAHPPAFITAQEAQNEAGRAVAIAEAPIDSSAAPAPPLRNSAAGSLPPLPGGKSFLRSLPAFVIGVLLIWAAIFGVGYAFQGPAAGHRLICVFCGFTIGMLAMFFATRVYRT